MFRVMQPVGDEFNFPAGTPEARFARLYADHGADILAYALRRAAQPDDAAEILAETFLVAWRRLEDVPSGAEARLWLYGIARNTLANHRRGNLRRVRLAERLQAEVSAGVPASGALDAEGAAILGALKLLDKADQEVLLLAGWEELTPAEIAKVLEITAGTARGRLHRARHRLRKKLAGDAPVSSFHSNERTIEGAR
jgi:RNA polymerase sigma factor (sigma-70 family)